MRPLILILAILIPVSRSLPCATAGEIETGKLDRFADAATKPAERKDPLRERARSQDLDYSEEDEETPSESLLLELSLVALLCAAYGGVGSWVRTAGSDSSEFSRTFPRREVGEPLIPHFAVETSWQEAGVDVSALALGAEAGYGPFAIEYRSTRYSEEQPAGLLEIRRIHGLYRMSFSRYVELDLGFGRMTLLGNRSSGGFSLTTPLKVYPSEHFGFEIRPAWAWIDKNVISDAVFLVAGRLSNFTIKGGYRRVAVSGVALDGPVVAVGFNL